MDHATALSAINDIKILLEPKGLTLNLEHDEVLDSIKGELITLAKEKIPIILVKLDESVEWILNQSASIISLHSFSELDHFVDNLILKESLPKSLYSIENILLSNLVIKLNSKLDSLSQLSFTVGVDNWNLSLGITNLSINNIVISFNIEKDGITCIFQGQIIIDNKNIPLQGNIQNGFSITGKLENIDLIDLVNNLVGVALNIPIGFPSIDLHDAQFSIRFVDNNPTFILHSQLNSLGLTTLIIQKIDDKWETVIASLLSDEWKFSNFSSLFQPLDQLKIASPLFTLSTFYAPDFILPNPEQGTKVLNIRKDFNLSADLKLQGLGLDFIGKLIGKENLPIELIIHGNLEDAKISTALNQTIILLPDVIVFDKFVLVIDPNPFKISIDCQATVTIFDTILPKFKVSASIEEGSTQISLETIEPWENVFGIKGLFINKAVLEIETSPIPKYGILGDIRISDKIIQAAVQFTNGIPSMIAGSFQGKLSLQEVISELVRISLPNIFDISIQNFDIIAVANPLGVTIGDVSFDPGLCLQGTLGLSWLELYVKVIVNPDNGIYAHGSLTEIISFGNILSISNSDGDGPPMITLDTRISTIGTQVPFLFQMSGLVNFLGLKESVKVNLDSTGYSFNIEKTLGPTDYKWSVTVKPPDFTAEGLFNFDISESFGPIIIPPNLNLGKISLSTKFNGTTSIGFTNNRFSAKIKGGFHFQGLDLEIPEITLSASHDSLENFTELVIKQIRDNIEGIFAEILDNPEKWLNGIKDGLINGVENIAKVLKEKFNRSVKQIGIDIRDTLGKGSTAAATGLKELGESAENIAIVLISLGDPSKEVRLALSDAGFNAEDISVAMQTVFPGIPHLDTPSIGHVDIPLTPHGDSPLTPHVDTPLTPHGDMASVGHGDVSSKERIDIPSVGHLDVWTGHIDARGLIHGDFAGIHGDTALTPYIDSPLVPHLDTKLSPHLDIAKIGHGDISSVGHIDFPAVGHGDTPAIPHGDIP